MNCRRSRPIGLWRLRSGIWIPRTFPRAVVRRVVRRRPVRSCRLVSIRIHLVRRWRPVGAMVRWLWRVIRSGRSIGLDWFRNVARVSGTFGWPVSRRIARLHSLGRCCLRGLIRCRGPVGLHRFRSAVRVHRPIRREVCGMIGNRYRFAVGIRSHLRGLPCRGLSVLGLAWPVRYRHWGRDGLRRRRDVHRRFAMSGWRLDLPHLGS
jgi:hypothetical protein